MRLIKSTAILILILFLAVTVVYSQGDKSDTVSADNKQVTGDAIDNGKEKEKEKNVSDGAVVVETKDTTDEAGRQKEPEGITKNDGKKGSKKAVTVKKTPAVIAEVKNEVVDIPKNDADFLLIDEGNFKYKRIPDIKLPEIKSEESLMAMQNGNAEKNDQNKKSGTTWISKSSVDVIIKIGALLLILLVFILYKSRLSAPGRKSSKKRNVLNSYRK